MSLENEIEYLDLKIKAMAGQVETNLDYAMDVYFHFKAGVDYPPVEDYKVNAYEREIERICLLILFKERLFASDMRKVTGIMTMVEDLERLGDHAQDLLEFALKLENKPDKGGEGINLSVKKLCDFVSKMVKSAIESYIKRDLNLAQTVIQSDDEADRQYASLIDALVEFDKNPEASSEFAIYTTLIVKYLERIGDHATNIAEWVIYINTGFYKDAQLV